MSLDRSRLDSGMNSAHSRLGDFGRQISHTLLLAGVAAGTALAAGITSAIKQYAAYEQTQIAFAELFGGIEQGKAMLADLSLFARRTPFEIGDVESAARRLKAYQYAAEDIIPTLRIIGDAASGLGLGAGGIEQLTLALGQMKMRGFVSGEEIRQLTGAGVNVWGYLTEEFGITTAKAMEKAEKKELDFARAFAAINAGLVEDFGGMMEAQAQTLGGLWSNVKDTATITMRSIGKMIVETFGLRGKVGDALKTLEGVAAVFSDEGGIWKGIEKVFGRETKDKVLGFFAQVARIWREVKELFRTMGDDFAPLKEDLARFASEILPSIYQLTQDLQALWESIGPTIVGVLDAFLTLSAAIMQAYQGDWKAAGDSINTNTGAALAGLALLMISLKRVCDLLGTIKTLSATASGAQGLGLLNGVTFGGLLGQLAIVAAAIAALVGLVSGLNWMIDNFDAKFTNKTRSIPIAPHEQAALDEQLSNNNGMYHGGVHGQGFANGGIASGPSSGYLALLHGTELITPMDKVGSTGATINIYGSRADASAIAAEVRKVLRGEVGGALSRTALMGA
jgi:tape measure domain-containing protein